MSSFAERLRFILEADISDAQNAFESLGRTADRDLGKVESRLDKTGAMMTKAGAAMMAVGTLGAVGLMKAAGAASDLNEAVNVTEITFGDAADEIDAFAKTAAASLGQSERAAREATAQFGGLLQNLGWTNREAATTSIQLTKLASDLGSAFNKDPAVAVQALGSALRGETEPIRQFNVMLSDAAVKAKAVEMGLAATEAEVDANAKAQASLALIMEQTSRYQGDFANTSDSAANAQRVLTAQWEDFQAQLGQGVLPVMQDVLGAANGLLGGVNNLNESTGGLVTTVATWGTGLLLAGGAVTTVVGKVIQMREALGGLATGANAAKVSIAALTAAALAATAIKVHEEFTRAETAVDRYAVALRQAADAGVPWAETVKAQLTTSAAAIRMMDELGVNFDELARALEGGAESWKAYSEELIRNGQAAGLTAPELLGLRIELEYLGEGAEVASGKMNVFTSAMQNVRDVGATVIARIQAMGGAAGELATGIGKVSEKYAELLGLLDAEDAYDNVVGSLDEVRSAAFEAFLAAQNGALDAGAKADELERKNRDLIRSVIAYGDEIGMLPEEVLTDIQVALDQGDYDRVEAKLRELERARTAVINIKTGASSVGSLYTPPPIPLPREPKALGGPVAAGMPYWVGERGPELFVPGQSGGIVPNHATGGGARTVNHFHIQAIDPVAAGEAVVQALRDYQRRNGPGWLN